MQLSEVINVNRIESNINIHSKKRALEELSNLVAKDQTQLEATDIFDSLLSRERLGATGVGYGFAIPHCRLNKCEKITGAFIHLSEGIDYDAIDNQPVNMLFALVVPEESTDEHLQVLALLASMFNDENFRNKIQKTSSNEEIYKLLMEWQKPD